MLPVLDQRDHMGHACVLAVNSGHSLAISMSYEREFMVPAYLVCLYARLGCVPRASTVGRITPKDAPGGV